jgi:hypothetical protein
LSQGDRYAASLLDRCIRVLEHCEHGFADFGLVRDVRERLPTFAADFRVGIVLGQLQQAGLDFGRNFCAPIRRGYIGFDFRRAASQQSQMFVVA